MEWYEKVEEMLQNGFTYKEIVKEITSVYVVEETEVTEYLKRLEEMAAEEEFWQKAEGNLSDEAYDIETWSGFYSQDEWLSI